MKWYFCLTDACLKPVFQIHLNHNSLQPLFLDHTVLADVEGVAVVWVTAQSCKTVTDLTKLDEKKIFFSSNVHWESWFHNFLRLKIDIL